MSRKGISGLMILRITAVLIAVMIVITQFHSEKVILPEATARSGIGSQAVLNKVKKVDTAGTRDSVGVSLTALPIKQELAKVEDKKKVVYLTFDDGPSDLTDQVLDILKEAKAPSTFFVLGAQAKRSPEIINRIVEAGHALGNHTYNHEYDKLYHNFTEFWRQIKQTEEVVNEITGFRPQLVRAPGGTYGHFDDTYFNLLEQGGYKVFDWDLDTGDSKRKGVPAAEIIRNITSAKQKDKVIVLMHDGAGHGETVKALPEIIAFYKDKGYEFRALTDEVKPVQFTIDSKVKSKGRTNPSVAWVESHIVPNSALFGPPKALYVEAGGVEMKLNSGEYELRNGQYLVPLRATMERLGAKVSWNHKGRSAVISWGKATVTLDTEKNTLAVEVQGQLLEQNGVKLEVKNGSLWLPLRTLLETTGHDVVSVISGVEENRVQAL
ncbi:polysaccharide deacetylase [Paenibacillus anaericanus]|nr:polysaccharide deacetylase [Paenibacillus anaericanus]